MLDLPDLDLAKALGVVEANGNVRAVRLAALLMFGKDDALRRFLPGHEAAFQVLRGLDVEVNDFFRWPLLRVMEEIEARGLHRRRHQEHLQGPRPEVPPQHASRFIRSRTRPPRPRLRQCVRRLPHADDRRPLTATSTDNDFYYFPEKHIGIRIEETVLSSPAMDARS